MKDFQEEIAGYLYNGKIARMLDGIRLAKGRDNISANLLRCYEALTDAGIFGSGEVLPVSAWLKDLEAIL
jgi:hypothetical protein